MEVDQSRSWKAGRIQQQGQADKGWSREIKTFSKPHCAELRIGGWEAYGDKSKDTVLRIAKVPRACCTHSEELGGSDVGNILRAMTFWKG